MNWRTGGTIKFLGQFYCSTTRSPVCTEIHMYFYLQQVNKMGNSKLHGQNNPFLHSLIPVFNVNILFSLNYVKVIQPNCLQIIQINYISICVVFLENYSLLMMKISFKKKSCNSEGVQVDSQVLEVSIKCPVNFAGDGTPGKKKFN